MQSDNVAVLQSGSVIIMRRSRRAMLMWESLHLRFPFDQELCRQAGRLASDGAVAPGPNGYKIKLIDRTVMRALRRPEVWHKRRRRFPGKPRRRARQGEGPSNLCGRVSSCRTRAQSHRRKHNSSGRILEMAISAAEQANGALLVMTHQNAPRLA